MRPTPSPPPPDTLPTANFAGRRDSAGRSRTASYPTERHPPPEPPPSKSPAASPTIARATIPTDMCSPCDHSPIRTGRRNGLLGFHRQTGRRRPRSLRSLPNQQIPRPSDHISPPARRRQSGRTRKRLDALDEPAPAIPNNRRGLRMRILERLRRQPQLRRHKKNGTHSHTSPLRTGRDDTTPTTHRPRPTSHRRRHPNPNTPLAPPPNVRHRPRPARRPTDTSPTRTTPATIIGPQTAARAHNHSRTAPPSPDNHPPPPNPCQVCRLSGDSEGYPLWVECKKFGGGRGAGEAGRLGLRVGRKRVCFQTRRGRRTVWRPPG